MLRLLKLILVQQIDRSTHTYFMSHMLQMDEDEVAEFEATAQMHLAEAVLEMETGEAKNLMLMVLAMANDTDDTSKIFDRIKKLRRRIADLHLEKRDCTIANLLLDNLEDKEGAWHHRLGYFVRRLERFKANGELKLEPTVVVLTTLHSSKGLEWG